MILEFCSSSTTLSSSSSSASSTTRGCEASLLCRRGRFLAFFCSVNLCNSCNLLVVLPLRIKSSDARRRLFDCIMRRRGGNNLCCCWSPALLCGGVDGGNGIRPPLLPSIIRLLLSIMSSLPRLCMSLLGGFGDDGETNMLGK